MTRTVLVTGSAGFVGRHSAAGLHAAGWTVTGVDLQPPIGRVAWASVIDDAAAEPILDRIRGGEFKVVVHNAAISDTRAPDDQRLRYINRVMPVRVARACAVSGTRLIHASSGSVYGRVPHGIASREADPADARRCSGPLNPYARSKLGLDEALVRTAATHSLDFVALRYTNVFGPGEHTKGSMASILSQIVTTAATGRPIRLFDDTLTAARDYLPVQTLVTRLLALLDAPAVHGIYNCGSGTAVSFAQLLDWCTAWAGAPIPLIGVPNPAPSAYQYWTCADMTRLRTALPGLAPVTVADIAAAAHALFLDARRAPALQP
ncbi:NAD-dependent epimerase/dehydratase family protein [Nocardia puris]|uniref:NAD-dependent epimerase/dehydratase family protein n=1 Tax=Nocardia puris TaxID=208602 RepID=UPI0018931EBF|nr:NAD(P)-dependent oxidoreductase [Nocardia puris]MBF6215831.1 NAD-dependent epimerase/dehydratase family protein [Nocardia puris]